MPVPGAKELESMTPMMRQFYEIKSRADDAVLFFRMGDFYEIFGDDALEVAPKLELVLTSRERGDKQRIPFCGVPHHSAKNYWLKLLKMGYRVALADQIENPEEAKGLVKRDIIQVLTPGCIDELEGLEADQPNYLMAVYEEPKKRRWAVAVVDISTGDFRCGELESLESFSSLVAYFRPREVLARQFILEEVKSGLSTYCQSEQVSFAALPEAGLRDSRMQHQLLQEVFGDPKLGDQPCGKIPGAAALVTAILEYLQSLHASFQQFLGIQPLMPADVMQLDETAIRDLELFETARRRQSDGSLFRAINETRTPMGARALRASLAAPFVCPKQIVRRQQGVARLLELPDLLTELRQALLASPDLERLATRVVNGKASPMELGYMREVLAKALGIHEQLKASGMGDSEPFAEILSDLGLAHKAWEFLSRSLVDQPGHLGSDLQVIRDGFDADFDEKRLFSQHGQNAILSYEAKLRQETGISSLKIKQHKSFGLLIEVTKANLARVPKTFVRRQTMVNNERFVTEALLELDENLSAATDQALAQEQLIYQQILGELTQYKRDFHLIASALAQLDLLHSFAWKARESSYQRPVMEPKAGLVIIGGRHPVVESMVGSSQFTPNDVIMEEPVRHLLITGPNMAGKSTVMRQTALVAILHQIGSYVPAREARLPIFDRIFTRVGASDDLSRGQSTFMVEMSEAAQILRQATAQSLVILDEVGRGTSTQDGLAIASAILESLVIQKRCYTLFATHYHELVPLADTLPGLAKVQTEVVEEDEKIHFTHRLIPGASGSSFGLEVAKLAGVPAAVILRAEEFLLQNHAMERGVDLVPDLGQTQSQLVNGLNSTIAATDLINTELLPLESRGLSQVKKADPLDEGLSKDLLERLRKINIHKTTPLQALNILDQLKVMAERKDQPELFEDFAH